MYTLDRSYITAVIQSQFPQLGESYKLQDKLQHQHF